MIPGVVLGTIAVVIGLLGFLYRQRLSQMSTAWNKRFGKPGEFVSSVGTPRYFGIGAILMALCGVATIVYSVATGSAPGSNSASDALFVIIVAAVGFIVLGTIMVLMYLRYLRSRK